MSVRPSDRPADQKSAVWSRRCLAAIVALGMMAVTACTEPASEPATEPADAGAVRLYGSDGNMTSSFGGTFKDEAVLLNGMRGTSPLTPLSEDFKRRLRTVDPKLTNDFLYAAEGYDAVMIAA